MNARQVSTFKPQAREPWLLAVGLPLVLVAVACTVPSRSASQASEQSAANRDFGFASLLGGETKQLIVSQTVPRGGRHWIVDISSDGATLFDSYDWDLGREEVCVHDFDGDGISEISMLLTSFWGFGAMSMAESPMRDVVFKYEANVRKYMPDKSAFLRGLTDIDEDVRKIDPNENPREGSKGSYLATRLDILLRYVYAGRDSYGWSFFDRAYNLTHKRDVKREIKRILDSEPVYRYVYGLQPLKRHSL